eukprot:206076_1
MLHGPIEGLLRQLAALFRVLQDLVEEHAVVKGQAQPHWVSVAQGGEGTVPGLLVCVLRGLLLRLAAGCHFGMVAMVVALHLVEEDLGFVALTGRDQGLSEERENVRAYAGQLLLNLGAVLLDHIHVGGVALLLLPLLDGGNDPPGSTTGADHVLVRD